MYIVISFWWCKNWYSAMFRSKKSAIKAKFIGRIIASVDIITALLANIVFLYNIDYKHFNLIVETLWKIEEKLKENI